MNEWIVAHVVAPFRNKPDIYAFAVMYIVQPLHTQLIDGTNPCECMVA